MVCILVYAENGAQDDVKGDFLHARAELETGFQRGQVSIDLSVISHIMSPYNRIRSP